MLTLEPKGPSKNEVAASCQSKQKSLLWQLAAKQIFLGPFGSKLVSIQIVITIYCTMGKFTTFHSCTKLVIIINYEIKKHEIQKKS